MIATHRVITSGRSCVSALRDVMTVPAKRASGTAYWSTIRFRVEASFDPKSCRQAATKPSKKLTTIGRSAPTIVVRIAISVLLAGQDTIDNASGVSAIVGRFHKSLNLCQLLYRPPLSLVHPEL